MGRGRGTAALLAVVSLLAAALPIALVTASAAPAAATTTPVKIMPLGDSITLGLHDAYASPGGYRDALENSLVNGGYSSKFDFVGTQSSGPTSLADKDHEGHSGYTIGAIRANIFTYLAKNPDVVLLMIGTNDIGTEGGDAGVLTPIPDSRLDDFVNQLRQLVNTILGNTNATVILAKTTPWKVQNRPINHIHDSCSKWPNERCEPDIFREKRSASYRYGNKLAALAGARVKIVDMFSNPTFLYAKDSPTWMADENHPNQTGYNQMAARWYPVLKNVLDSKLGTPPSAPQNVRATAGNGQATITFDAPASSGSSAITSYRVDSVPEGKNATGGASARSLTVTGLTNGKSYTFNVHAVNGAGPGPDATSNAVTPKTVPGAPTGVTATAGNAKVTVKWTPPSNNGGSAITGYAVYAYQGTSTTLVSTTLVAAPATQVDVTNGIANGSPYTFRVAAGNVVGVGPKSAVAGPVTPTGSATKPNPPTNVQATAGDGQASVSWATPNNGGSPITGYTIRAYENGSTTPFSSTTAAGAPKVVTGLTNGQSYTFRVIATNGIGDSDPSALSNAVIPQAPTKPDPPTNVQAVAGNGQATVSFTPPSNNGGSAVIDYTINAYENGGTTPVSSTLSTTTSKTVTGLQNGTPYTFKVTARNSVGSSQESSASNPVTPSNVAPTQIGDLSPASASSTRYWRNKGATGALLKVLSTEYQKGVEVDGSVTPFTLTYNLPGSFSTFQSDIGIDATVCPGIGNVRFKVFKNNELTPIYDSGTTAVTGKTNPTLKIAVDITNATTLTLRVEKLGTSTCNYADWADAKLVP